MTPLLRTPEAEVRAATGSAFGAIGDDARALGALSALPGFKTMAALATVVLSAFDPVELGVMDDRAFTGLEIIGLSIERGWGETVRYLVRLREIRDCLRQHRAEVTARDVDKGLFILGG